MPKDHQYLKEDEDDVYLFLGPADLLTFYFLKIKTTCERVWVFVSSNSFLVDQHLIFHESLKCKVCANKTLSCSIWWVNIYLLGSIFEVRIRVLKQTSGQDVKENNSKGEMGSSGFVFQSYFLEIGHFKYQIYPKEELCIAWDYFVILPDEEELWWLYGGEGGTPNTVEWTEFSQDETAVKSY